MGLLKGFGVFGFRICGLLGRKVFVKALGSSRFGLLLGFLMVWSSERLSGCFQVWAFKGLLYYSSGVVKVPKV